MGTSAAEGADTDGITLTDSALQLSVLAAGPDDDESPVVEPVDEEPDDDLPFVAGFDFGAI